MSIRFTDATVSNDRKRWTVTGYACNGKVTLTRIEGDITDIDGLREAMMRHCNRPRYFRYSKVRL